jgi:hypothetical protein
VSNEGAGGGSDPGLVPGGASGGAAPFEPPPSFQPPAVETAPPGLGAPSFPPPGFAPNPGGLTSEPHFFQNGYWVAWDRQHWWNGSTWIPGPPPARGTSYGFGTGGPGGVIAAIVSLVGFVIFAGIFFSVCQSMPHGPGFGP